MIHEKPLVSIVIPAYNEARYIGSVIESIEEVTGSIDDFFFEVIVVDDGSTDQTRRIVSKYSHVLLVHQDNAGKGAAVQRGISMSQGKFILIQDADLEYNVNDYKALLNALPADSDDNKVAVYGSRTLYKIGHNSSKRKYRLKPVRGQQIGPWIGNIVLSTFVAVLYGKWISDTLTAYKIYSREFFTHNKIVSSGFEADHEITAKLLKQRFRINEVPVSYSPRSVQEGKKIRTIDGLKALWVYLCERFKVP